MAHPLTFRRLIAHMGFHFIEHITDLCVKQHHDAVAVDYRDIVRLHKLARANRRDVNRAEALFYRSLGINLTGSDGESHLPQNLRITNANITHQADHAARLEGRRQQTTEEVIVAQRRRGHHQNIADAALLDHHMKHPVVAWRHRHDYRAARLADALLSRTDCRSHQPLTIPGFMGRHRPDRLIAAQNRPAMAWQVANHKALPI